MEDRHTQIDDRKERILRNKVILLVKVLWSHHEAKNVTWKRKDTIKELYSNLFQNKGVS